MIQEQIIATIDEIQGMLAKLAVQEVITETKSFGKRRKLFKAKGDLTAAARELATPEGIDKAKAAAYVGYARMESGVESRVMSLMKQHEDGKINIGQLEWGLKKGFAGAYQDAYIFGQRSVGYTGDLMDEDIAFLRSFRRTENQYLRKFMRAITADKLVLDRYKRLKMYVDTVKTVFDHARVEASPNWVEIYWTPTKGVAHCEDCLRLALNSPYTKETLPCVPKDGSTACKSRCKCHLMIRYKKPGEKGSEEIKTPGVKPPGEDYEIHPELYDKFKGDVPEFRFFMDKNLGNPVAARKEFVAAVKKSGVGFTASNYDDPFNPRFFKSNRLWFDTQKVRELEKNVLPMSREGKALRKKRQAFMKQRVVRNKELKKTGLRWIRPDGYGGYSVNPDGKPMTLFPKG